MGDILIFFHNNYLGQFGFGVLNKTNRKDKILVKGWQGQVHRVPQNNENFKAGLFDTTGSLPIDGALRNTNFYFSGLLHLTVNIIIANFIVFLTKHHVLLGNSYI